MSSAYPNSTSATKPSLSLTTLLVLSALHLPVSACGPDFPLQLLSDRGQHLTDLPEPLFASEILALASKTPTFTTEAPKFIRHFDWQQEQWISAAVQAEQQLLPEVQAAVVAQMRQQTSAAAALTIGQHLPKELLWYTAGAVAFHQQDRLTAIQLWRQLLELPAAEQQQRRSWALFSLAHALRLQATEQTTEQTKQQTTNQTTNQTLPPTNGTAMVEALELWQQLQMEVSTGLPDPLQLAVASLGEQARIAYQQGNWTTAIGLYAAQAQYDETGRASLLQLSRHLLALSDDQLTSLLQQPKVASLLSRYLMTQQQALSMQAPEQLQRLTQLLLQHPNIKLDNALQLAVLSYQQQQFTLVEALLPHATESPMRWWLSAKMALRKNDLTAAAAAYAKAAKAFPTELTPATLSIGTAEPLSHSDWLTAQQRAKQCRIHAEAGVLQLQRGDYVSALQLLYHSGSDYWQDTAYIAERVLTVAELQQFVDEHVPVGTPKASSEWQYFGDTAPDTLIRHLLARRLMRAGDYAQAEAYWSDPSLRDIAQQYALARQQGQANWLSGLRQVLGWSDIPRAQALFQAARIMRTHGLALFGFELAPDFQVYYGQFTGWPNTTPFVGAWSVPEAEQQRYAAHEAVPNRRFHYRYQAAEIANASADWLPVTSQAYAATLCHATTWLIHRDPEEAQSYYQRYLATGPYVSWGADFGIRCPAPDFDKARQRASEQVQQQLRHQLRQIYQHLKAHLIPWSGVGVLLLVGVVGWIRARRRHRSQPV